MTITRVRYVMDKMGAGKKGWFSWISVSLRSSPRAWPRRCEKQVSSSGASMKVSCIRVPPAWPGSVGENQVSSMAEGIE